MARQKRIPGMEPETHPEIDAAAEEYREARDKRMKLTQKEVEAADKLLTLMDENKLPFYEYDADGVRRRVDVRTLRKAKVKAVKDEDDAGE